MDGRTGIDIFGNLLESSILSENRELYGDLHNMGHVLIAYCHDPDHRHLEGFALMGDPAANMRDPVFYRWHAYIDDLFQEHKQRLPPYTNQEIGYQGIRISAVNVQPERGPANTFQTFWQQSDIDFSRGLDFTPRGNVFARITHLQHTPFNYVINITNTTGRQAMGTVRIFLAPVNNERGTPMFFRDQRLMMIELDRFPVACKPFQIRVTKTNTNFKKKRSFFMHI